MNGIARYFGLAAALSLALPLSGAIAQPPKPEGPALPLEYAAKFVCGFPDVTQSAMPSFATGAYYTAVNIHNSNRAAVVTYKVAVAPLGDPGPITAFHRPVDLKYDQAFEIDCRLIRRMLEESHIQVPPVYSGFLVIQSRTELDVVAVYTTAAAADKPVTAIHTERVPVRKVM